MHSFEPIRCAVFSTEPLNHACALLRVLQPLRKFKEHVIVDLGTTELDQGSQDDSQRIEKADIIVVQRAFPSRANRNLVDAILRSNKPVIYESDDLLDELPLYHPYSYYSRENRTIIREFIRRCDLIQVSTTPLSANYAKYNSNVRVVQNFLDPDHWFSGVPPPKREHRHSVVVGFFGTGTHKPDLEIVEDALAQLSQKHGKVVSFRFLGCTTPALQTLPGSSYCEQWSTYDRFPELIAREQIDIGIAPLLDTPLNRCKSDLKWLEYSALRIPAVYSAVTPYARSVRDGVTGLVVPNEPEAWFAALDRLVLDADLRAHIAEAAHKEVRATRTLDTGAPLFLDTLRTAASMRPSPDRADRVWDMVMHYEHALAEQASRLSKVESDLAWLEGRLPHRIVKGLRRLF